MTRDEAESGISRRTLLAAAAGTGGLGIAGGLGTAAVLRDEESFGGLFEAGALDLELDWESSQTENATTSVTETRATFQADLDPDARSGQALLELSLPERDENNPADVWFWTTCPDPPGTDLADVLQLDVYESDSTGTEGRHVVGGTLADVADTLRDRGAALDLGDGDTTCLSPGTEDYLLVRWRLDAPYGSGETLEFSFEFRARQCRHGENESPFPSLGPCGAGSCPCCQLVGKLELRDDDGEDSLDGDGDGLDDSYIQPDSEYLFTEGTSRYELRVGDTRTKGSGADTETTGVALDVVGVGGTPDPALCAVVLKAGTESVRYTDADTGSNDGFTPLLDSVADGRGGYVGISSITVGICVDEQDGHCPENCVEPTGSAGGTCP